MKVDKLSLLILLKKNNLIKINKINRVGRGEKKKITILL